MLKCALLICFFVALGNAIMKLLEMETTISIGYEWRTPLPAMTICDFPLKPRHIMNLTLVDFLRSDESLAASRVFTNYYKMDINTRVRLTNMVYQVQDMEFFPPTQSVSVLNGMLTKCVTIERDNKMELDSKIGLVS